jgi:hypothetical protein
MPEDPRTTALVTGLVVVSYILPYHTNIFAGIAQPKFAPGFPMSTTAVFMAPAIDAMGFTEEFWP